MGQTLSVCSSMQSQNRAEQPWSFERMMAFGVLARTVSRMFPTAVATCVHRTGHHTKQPGAIQPPWPSAAAFRMQLAFGRDEAALSAYCYPTEMVCATASQGAQQGRLPSPPPLSVAPALLNAIRILWQLAAWYGDARTSLIYLRRNTSLLASTTKQCPALPCRSSLHPYLWGGPCSRALQGRHEGSKDGSGSWV